MRCWYVVSYSRPAHHLLECLRIAGPNEQAGVTQCPCRMRDGSGALSSPSERGMTAHSGPAVLVLLAGLLRH